MDTLHTVLRSIQGKNKTEASGRRDHVEVFREFLAHLDRGAKRKGHSRKTGKAKSRRRR